MRDNRTPNTTCQQCGNPFYVRPGQRGEVKHCSLVCQHQAAIDGIPDRFWSYVDRSGGPDACWPWTGGRKNGYGLFTIRTETGRKVARANRMALILSGVDLPDDRLACHSCDNPTCCNPSHLFIGTPADNTRDGIRKGRIQGHLNADAVRAIRRLYQPRKMSYRKLGEMFGCSPESIRDVVKLYTWKDIE